MIRAIIFDCFGVLTADSWHEFRVSLPPKQQPLASELNHRYCRADISKDEFLKAVSELSGHSQSYVEQVIDDETHKNVVLFDYIKELKQHYKIGLLSNVGNNWIRDYFLTSGEQKLFDAFVFSFLAGVTKPDPRIFDMMLDKLGVKRSEAVMVDDIERYADAAKAHGMQAISYQDFRQFKNELEHILSHG